MKPVVQVVRDREALEAIVPAWEELAAQACEANPFYEHWILLPALRAQGAGSGFRCVLVWEAERLIGLFPFERTLTLKGLPAATLSSWRHRSYLLCTPLVRADAAAECLQALFDWLPQEAAIAEFRYIPSDGAFHSALSEATRKAACTVAPTADFSRALLRKGVENCMSAQLRRQLRRKERRLAERPGFAVTKVSSAAEIENFLALEASGWKAEAGGAFAASEASLRFGRAVLAEAQRRGRLHMVGIDCEQRAVARRVTLPAGAPRHHPGGRRRLRIPDRVRRIVCGVFPGHAGRALLPARIPAARRCAVDGLLHRSRQPNGEPDVEGPPRHEERRRRHRRLGGALGIDAAGPALDGAALFVLAGIHFFSSPESFHLQVGERSRPGDEHEAR